MAGHGGVHRPGAGGARPGPVGYAPGRRRRSGVGVRRGPGGVRRRRDLRRDLGIDLHQRLQPGLHPQQAPRTPGRHAGPGGPVTRPTPLRQTTQTTHTAADGTYVSRTWRPTMAIEITDSPDDNRYEARIDGRRAGVAEYMRTKESGLVVFTHTEVDPEY